MFFCQPTTLPLRGHLQATWGGENSLWVYSGQGKNLTKSVMVDHSICHV